MSTTFRRITQELLCPSDKKNDFFWEFFYLIFLVFLVDMASVIGLLINNVVKLRKSHAYIDNLTENLVFHTNPSICCFNYYKTIFLALISRNKIIFVKFYVINVIYYSIELFKISSKIF